MLVVESIVFSKILALLTLSSGSRPGIIGFLSAPSLRERECEPFSMRHHIKAAKDCLCIWLVIFSWEYEATHLVFRISLVRAGTSVCPSQDGIVSKYKYSCKKTIIKWDMSVRGVILDTAEFDKINACRNQIDFWLQHVYSIETDLLENFEKLILQLSNSILSRERLKHHT